MSDVTSFLEVLAGEDDVYWVAGHGRTDEQVLGAICFYGYELYGRPGEQWYQGDALHEFWLAVRSSTVRRRWFRDYRPSDITAADIWSWHQARGGQPTREEIAASRVEEGWRITCGANEPGAEPWCEVAL